jgi:L-2,4-diaminobutyrate decarboxylase
MAIKYFGVEGYAKLTDNSFSFAQEFAELVRSSTNFELVTEPDTNIVCFRFYEPSLSDSALDTINKKTQRSLFHAGGPLVSSTVIGKKVVLRAVLLNPLLDIKTLGEALQRIRSEAFQQMNNALNNNMQVDSINEYSTCYEPAS